MELKLEKKCRPSELQIGKRYGLVDEPSGDHILTVTAIQDNFVTLLFTDGTYGGVPLNVDCSIDFYVFPYFYEFPFSPLEEELI